MESMESTARMQEIAAASSREALLGMVESLTDSLRRAVQAIADNRVGLLEKEVRQQQERSLRLLAEVQTALAGHGHATLEQSPRFRRALHQLRAGTDCYAAVLEHSGRNLGMLRVLSSGSGGVSHPAAGSRSGTASWHG